ncbi:MAG: DUF2207 domain-containing protein [Chloroflexi bacterium]|nr:DUF2207 domain-containing protein [Chloroflexota bacterium]
MRACLLAILLFVLASGTAAAQSTSRSVDWQRFDVDLAWQTDGSLIVTETQTIDFHGTYQQGYRVIPDDRTTGITDISVSQVDSNGTSTPLAFTTSTDPGGLRVTWNFAPITDASSTFVVRYTAHGATRVYPNGDQLDWNAIYADRPGPVAASTVTLHLPGDVTATSVMSALYQVPMDRLPQQVGSGTLVDSRTLQFDVGGLPTSTGAEVRAQVPAALLPQVTAPPWQAAADQSDWLHQSVAPIANFLVLLLSVAIVAGGSVGLVLLWYSRVREPKVGPVPAVLETPPSDLAAPLAGTLVDGAADLRDAVAILFDLARRGVLSLKQEVGSEVRVVLHRSTEDPSLERYERVLLVALFGRGVSEGEILLSQSRLRFASAVPVLEQRLYEAVFAQGLFIANPMLERRRVARLGWTGVGIGAVLAIGAPLLLSSIVPAASVPGVLIVIVSLVLVWMARKVPRRTARGALEAARWRAFRGHLMQETHTLDDAYLAYAVALGADRAYLRQLEVRPSAAPVVYAGQAGPGPIIFLPGGWYGGGRGGQYGGGGGGGMPVPPTVGAPGGGGPQGWSDALADLLNAAAGALSGGGGSGPWSGGGWGGGGGGGGGSGGFS